MWTELESCDSLLPVSRGTAKIVVRAASCIRIRTATLASIGADDDPCINSILFYLSFLEDSTPCSGKTPESLRTAMLKVVAANTRVIFTAYISLNDECFPRKTTWITIPAMRSIRASYHWTIYWCSVPLQNKCTSWSFTDKFYCL